MFYRLDGQRSIYPIGRQPPNKPKKKEGWEEGGCVLPPRTSSDKNPEMGPLSPGHETGIPLVSWRGESLVKKGRKRTEKKRAVSENRAKVRGKHKCGGRGSIGAARGRGTNW